VIHLSDVPSKKEGELLWNSERDAADRMAREPLSAYLLALKSGRKEAWIGSWRKDYPKDLPDADYVFDIIDDGKADVGRGVIRCDKCRRLYIQTECHADKYECFMPEDQASL
jgi:hypothetical protein